MFVFPQLLHAIILFLTHKKHRLDPCWLYK